VLITAAGHKHQPHSAQHNAVACKVSVIISYGQVSLVLESPDCTICKHTCRSAICSCEALTAAPDRPVVHS
jgi:hypothetical protein